MVDRFDKKTRSYIMSRIRSETNLERNFRKRLWGAGLRYRTHFRISDRRDISKADIAFPSKRVAVFIDGDFWHGWNWKKMGKKPKGAYWQEKIRRNMYRDRKTDVAIRGMGWQVVRLWEHEIKVDTEKCVKKVRNELKGTS